MVAYAGKYKRTSADKYEDFLSKLGVGFMTRKAATASTPTMEISETAPGKWKIVTATTLSKTELNFEFGVAFDEKTPDGRETSTTVTKEGDNTWITSQKNKKSGGKDVTVRRTFTDAGIDVEMICDDVVSKQFFTRE